MPLHITTQLGTLERLCQRTVPREVAKNNGANEVPLSRLAMNIIRGLP